jgi:hypothetical protein
MKRVCFTALLKKTLSKLSLCFKTIPITCPYYNIAGGAFAAPEGV